MKVTFTITINGTDVSSSLVNRISFVPRINRNPPEAAFELHNSVLLTPTYNDEIVIKASVDSEVTMFTGVLRGIQENQSKFNWSLTAKGEEQKARDTDYTGRFRSDAGNGNMKTIILAMVDEKFPEWTYDDTSVPDIDYDFLTKSFQAENFGAILDGFVDKLDGYSWGVDENKKFYFKETTFSTVTSTITEGVNTVEDVVKDVDDTLWANIVRVYGKRFNVPVEQTLVGTGTATEFTLDTFPSASTSVNYASGTAINTAVEGVEDYDDETVYDAYFKPEVPALKFNVNTVTSADIIVKNTFYSQIFEEIPDAASIERNKQEKVKEFNDENVDTQQEAYDICNSYLAANNDPTYIHTIPATIVTQQQLEDWRTGKKVTFTDSKGVTEELNVYEAVYDFDPSQSVDVVTLRTNNRGTEYDTEWISLFRRIKQREAKERITGTSITKTFYWGGNVYVVLDNIAMDSQDADDGTFVLQDPWTGQDNRSLLGGTAVMRDEFTTTKVMTLSVNYNNTFTEGFNDEFFIDEDNSTGSWDEDNNYYVLGVGQVLQSREYAVGNGETYDTVTVTVSSSGTAFSLAHANSSTSFESGTSGVEKVLSASGDGMKYKITNTGGSPINITEVVGVYE